jgi:fatty acid desaturase
MGSHYNFLFYGIYISSAINHFIPSAAVEIPDQYKNKYAYYICQDTSNFCLDNPIWFWYTRGFNVQIEHHLIPFVPVENLRKMIPIVKELCVKHNYPYHHYPTFRSMWNDHYLYLASLSKNVIPNHRSEASNKHTYQAR